MSDEEHPIEPDGETVPPQEAEPADIPGAETGPEPDAEREPDAVSEADAIADPEAAAESDAEREPDAVSEPDATAGPEAAAESDAEREPDAAAEPDATAGPEAAAESDASDEPGEPRGAPSADAGEIVDGEPAGDVAALRTPGLERVLSGIRVRVSAEIGRARLPLGRTLMLPRGSVIELDRDADAPIDLYVNGKHFGCGQLEVTDDGEWALRLTSVQQGPARVMLARRRDAA